MTKYFTSLIFLGYAGLFLKMYFSGELILFVLPVYQILVIFCTVVFILLGVKSLRSKALHIPAVYLCIVAVPLIVGWSITPEPLSSATAHRRGIQTDLSQVRVKAPATFQLNSELRTFQEWIVIFANEQRSQEEIGKKVKITGFIAYQEGESSSFLISRFLISCCVADARPVGISVFHDFPEIPAEGEWLEIEGEVIQKQGVYGIQGLQIRTVPAPKKPYLY